MVAILVAVGLLGLSACNSPHSHNTTIESENINSPTIDYLLSDCEAIILMASYEYLTFEEAISEFATDVVIAQYVGSRSFGQHSTEFEFIVLDRILGYAPEQIFVYAFNSMAADFISGISNEVDIQFKPGELSFEYGVTYLLPLVDTSTPLALTEDAAFEFIRDAVIVLDALELSVMYSGPLELHTEALDLSSRTSVEQIIDHVAYLIEGNETSTREILPMYTTEEIIMNSPNVLVVDIGKPFRLAEEQVITDFMLTDIYQVIVAETLKGNAYECIYNFRDVLVVFPADTVFPGERHIIATESLGEGSTWHELTSRDSLFSIEHWGEIVTILGLEETVRLPPVAELECEAYDDIITDVPMIEVQAQTAMVQPTNIITIPNAIWAVDHVNYPNSDVRFWANDGSNRITVSAWRHSIPANCFLLAFDYRIDEAATRWGAALNVSIQRVTNAVTPHIRMHAGSRTEMRNQLSGLQDSWAGAATAPSVHYATINTPVGARNVSRITSATAVHVANPNRTEINTRNLVIHEMGHTLGWWSHPPANRTNYVMRHIMNSNVVIQPNEARHLRQIYDRFRVRTLPSSRTIANYSVHQAQFGWLPQVSHGAVGGRTGQARSLEAIRINLSNAQTTGNIRYRAHVQDIGWMPWVQNNAIAGTTGQGRRMEAIQIEVTGNLATRYHVRYRVLVSQVGWMAWAGDGATAGTTGQGRGIEAIEIMLILR